MEGDQLIIRDLKPGIGDGLSARRGAISAINCLPRGWFGATLLVSEEEAYHATKAEYPQTR